MNPQQDAVLEGMMLDGLVDNRYNVVRAEEGKAVSENRHSDRDLLDAHLATQIAPIGFCAEHTVAAAAAVEKAPMPIREDVADDPLFAGRAFLANHLLSDEECDAVVRAAEGHGLQDLLLCGGAKRRCARVPFASQELSDLLWPRVQPYLADLHVDRENAHMFLNKGMEGTWVPEGLSGVFRVVRYFGGGHISPHYDGEWVTDDQTRSIKTILLYLNDGYEGGHTRFLNHADDGVNERFEETGDGATKGCDTDVVGVVPADKGSAIVFDAKMLHEGTALEGGTKYLLRADIVYRQTEQTYPPDSRRGRAVALLNEAEYLEESGRSDLAVRNYRAAFKLCPELEYEG